MKFKFNSKYNTISGYVIGTFVICLLIIVMIFKFSILQVYLNKIITVTAPIIWGIVLAYLLNPILKFIERYVIKLTNRKKPHPVMARSISIFLTMALFFLIIYAIIASIIPEILTSLRNIFANLQVYFDNIQVYIDKKFSNIKNSNPELEEFIFSQMDRIEEFAMSMADSIKPKLNNIFSKDGVIANITGSALTLLIGLKDFLIGAIAAVYIMFSKEKFLAYAKKIVYAYSKKENSYKIINFASTANSKFISFLSGKALDSFIIGMICFIAMTVLKLPYAVLISVIVGITNMIPFFGPFIGAIPSGVLILLSHPNKTIVFVIMILVLQQIDGNIIGPKILGNQLGVNAFWILFSILIGGGFFGFAGMILAVPCFAVIYPIFRDAVNKRLVKKEMPISSDHYLPDMPVNKQYIPPEKKKNNK
ncbi:MAG: AI-2E family transporter [Ruminococcus sp.]|nr:AI-2E family transporter [Ruminococcus sp.]